MSLHIMLDATGPKYKVQSQDESDLNAENAPYSDPPLPDLR